ncbi:MAG: hypothetical protein ACYSR6_11950 [Planctomycetota bacterium]|jgi:hypothetical protein
MKTFLCLFLCFLAPVCAYAEVNTGYTVEWLSHQSSLIAEATPVRVENIKGPGDVWFTKTRFRLDKVIKGPQSDGDSVTIYDFSYNKSDVLAMAEAKKNEKPLLVFANVAEHLFKQIDGKYVLTQTQQFKSAYYADKAIANLFTPKFKLVTSFEELLKRARTQVEHEAGLKRRYWKGTIERKSLEARLGTEAQRHLYAGSSCYLWVPHYNEEQEESNKPGAGGDK